VSSRFDLSGKTAIVTGGGWGIGEHVARGLAEHGARVVIADVAADRAERVAAEICRRGETALAVTTDVCDPMAVDRLVETACRAFGTIDVLVNNAGGGSVHGRTVDLALADWQRTFDLTVTSAFLCSQRAGRVMIGQGHGTIVNVASIYGLVGYSPTMYDTDSAGNYPESLAYAAAKGAVVSMTRTLATYWAPHNIRVNAIAPGPVKTERLGTSISPATWQRLAERTLLKRPADCDDLVGAAVFLASSASAYVTGQILVVDGGWTAW
jgi:gluconate 5-dehydrogenase